jgi:hypothetical protein
MRAVFSLLFVFAALNQAQTIPVRVAERDRYPASKHGGNYMHNFYLPPSPSSTPWAPAWAPDGKTIAVSMQGSIWRVDPQTGAATEMTYSEAYHSSPAWTPDGKWFVYTADYDGKQVQLEVLNVETGETQALTGDEQIYTDPVFSPDGTKLAYVSTKPRGYFNVYIRAVKNGKWAGEEIAVSVDKQYARSRLYFGEWDMHIEPAWTKDGESLLLVSNQGVPLGSGAVWRVPAEANGMSKAVKILDEQSLFRTRPDVSIDGKRFIYSSMAGGADQFHHLYVLPVAGGYPYKMTFGDHEDFHPRWSPDGQMIAYISNEGGLPHLIVMETYGGRKKKVLITDRKWKRPMGRLEVTVVDEQTGRPIHARIQGVASDGKFYPPQDAYSRIAPAIGHIFHVDGGYTTEAPAGEMRLQAVRGFEYWPKEVDAEIQAGKATKVTVALSRMTDRNAAGWYSGSTHVHMNYGGNLRNTLENLIFMSKAEDQDIVNELVANKDNRILDWQYFVPDGGEHPVSKNDPDIHLLVGEEYRPPFYGHTFFIGLRDHLISPFTTGYEGTGIESLYPSNTDMFRKAIAQDAVTGYVHPFSGETEPLESNLGGAKGFPVDAALGTVHCLEWSTSTRAGHAVWRHAMNNDLKITPTGGEDSISNLHISKLVGSVRTYAYLGDDFSVSAWKQALRDGKTFFTTGPLLDLKIDGKIPGEAVRLPAAGGKVSVKASVQSISPLAKVILYHNGEVLKELTISEDHHSAALEEEIAVESSGWFSLYAEGPVSKFLDANYAQAGTNAVRVYVGEHKIRDAKSAEYFVRWIDKLHAMAEEWAWWRSQAEKDHVYAQFREAQEIYRKFIAEAASVENGR